jgi:NitT/TauT family transport system substrate-binding protein
LPCQCRPFGPASITTSWSWAGYLLKGERLQTLQNRRRFLAGLSAASATGLVIQPQSLHAEPPPETATVRLADGLGVACVAAQFVAQDLLRVEGFSDVRYVVPDWDKEMLQDTSVWFARGEIDFDWNFVPVSIASIEAGLPIKVLAGLHSGCLELMAHENVRKISDLKGKRVGVDSWHWAARVYLSLMTAYIGLDPKNDIEWVVSKEPGLEAGSMKLFIDGKIDAFLGTAPQPQMLRALKIGHTILNTTVDQPWSSYYCCTLAGSANYTSKYPTATKRVLRAILKSIDLCGSAPQLIARQLVDKGLASNYELLLESLGAVGYDRWRDFDTDDAIRFYTLRMRDVGVSNASPNQIIADGTDWRFLNEIKRELKT